MMQRLMQWIAGMSPAIHARFLKDMFEALGIHSP